MFPNTLVAFFVSFSLVHSHLPPLYLHPTSPFQLLSVDIPCRK
jgi:hypothetical protein